MKYFVVFILSILGGVVGASFFTHNGVMLGATTARTTITNPWTFSATTTTKNITVTTTNSATSTVQVGCIQMTATSTATPIRLVIGKVATSSVTYRGTNTVGLMGWQYGKCYKI